MEKLGVVSEVNGQVVKIAVHRDSACGENCAACGLCTNCDMLVTIKSNNEFCVGDKVRLLTADKSFLKFSGIGYLSLTGLLFLGALTGALFGSDLISFLLALLFVAGGVPVLKKFLKKVPEIKIEKL